MSLQIISEPRGPLISAAFASVEHLKKSSEYAFIVTNTKICRAPSMKLGPNRWLMERGLLGEAPDG